jgi:hypothetical protein
MKMTAGQHASGILTRSQSAKGRSGYQTLLRTPELVSDEDMRLLEQRAQCLPTGETTGKWQYGRMPDGRQVITRIIPVPEPDEFGRGGRFLAHSLLFDPADQAQTAFAPFDLMRPENYFSSLEQALAADGFATGNAPAVSLEITEQWREEARELLCAWSGEQLHKLARLMRNPQQGLKQGHGPQLIGTGIEILDLMKVVFYLAAPADHPWYSFDTHFAEQNGTSGAHLWGKGGPFANMSGTSCFVNASRRQVSLPESLTPSSAYGKWIETMTQSDLFPEWWNHLQNARIITGFLEESIEEPKLTEHPPEETGEVLEDELSEDFLKSLIWACPNLLRERIAEILPDQLSISLRDAASGQTTPLCLEYLLQGEYESLCCEILAQTLLAHPDQELTAADVSWLSGPERDHALLRLLPALRTGTETRRLQMLAEMDAGQYEQCATALCTRHGFQPAMLFSTSHLEGWFRFFASSVRLEDIQQAINGQLAHANKKEWPQLARIVPLLTPDLRRPLLEWLRTSGAGLAALEAALTADETIAAGPESKWSLQNFKNVFRRKP